MPLPLRLGLVTAPVVDCPAPGVAELAAGSPVTAPRPLGSPPCCAWTDPAMNNVTIMVANPALMGGIFLLWGVNLRREWPFLPGVAREPRRLLESIPSPSKNLRNRMEPFAIRVVTFVGLSKASSIFVRRDLGA
ncbi:hypothetical protein ABIB73_003230 [Bradyrhizobium sp. F1.4.3]